MAVGVGFSIGIVFVMNENGCFVVMVVHEGGEFQMV